MIVRWDADEAASFVTGLALYEMPRVLFGT